MCRLPAAAVLLVLALALAGGAQATEGDAMSDLPGVLQRLQREARAVWTDARPVVVEVDLVYLAGGLQTTATMVFVTSAGIVDGSIVTLGEELPTVHLRLREEETAQAERARWEKRFGVLRKFRWHHCSGEWLDVCGLPRPERLEPGESLHLSLEVHRRTALVVMRYSEGDAACRLDGRGTIYPFAEDGR